MTFLEPSDTAPDELPSVDTPASGPDPFTTTGGSAAVDEPRYAEDLAGMAADPGDALVLEDRDPDDDADRRALQGEPTAAAHPSEPGDGGEPPSPSAAADDRDGRGDRDDVEYADDLDDQAPPGEGQEVALTGDEELLAVTVLDEERAASPYDRPGDWYVVHTYSGYENKVKNNLASRVRSMGVEERIHEVVIPMEDVIEYKGGRKTVVQKKVFPGYLLVRMDLDDNSWYVVRNTPGVTGFVGSGAKPTPLSRREVEDILGVEQPAGEAPVEKKVRPRLDFQLGDQVRVTQGPFADFDGAIAEIDEDRAKLKVLVNIFGRETPVELEFGQVAKI